MAFELAWQPKQGAQFFQEEVSTNYLAGFNESQIHILENSLLEIVVDTVNGNILSSRLKDYPIVPGSDGGVRVLGSGLDSDGEQMRFYMSSGFADLESAGLSNKPTNNIYKNLKLKFFIYKTAFFITVLISL